MRRAVDALVSLGFVSALFSGLSGATGCIDAPDPPVLPDDDRSTPFPSADGGSQSSTGPAQPGTPTKPKPALEVLTEVVYVLMDDYDGGNWMCTGSLVAKDTVVTAAHCIDESHFHNWTIVAPLAKDKPRVTASNPKLFSDAYDEVANPDVGLLKLDEPIEVPAYAVLTDVSARVEKGEKLDAAVIVRTAEEFEAPLQAVERLAVSSTTTAGYDHGFGTPLFSHGGDSGTGLFLIENGQVTHKLIGVARQPEPDAKIDHFTRVDPALLEWFKQND